MCVCYSVTCHGYAFLNTCKLLQDIRENVGDRDKRHEFQETMSRKHFLSAQDVRNLRRKVEEDRILRHSNDSTSTTIRVKELQQENFDPILFFKEQGVFNSAYPELPDDSFVLAIQTEFQKQLYVKNAHKILCVDSTHGTNAYRFKLITCVVPDQFGQGILSCLLLKKLLVHSYYVIL